MRHIILSMLLFTACSGIGGFERSMLLRAVQRSITDVSSYDELINRLYRFGVYRGYINHIHANRENFRFLYGLIRRYPNLSNDDIKSALSNSIYTQLKSLDIDEVIDIVRLLALN